MSWIATGIAWIKDAIRGVHLDPHWQPPEAAAEIDSERMRYSAKRYCEAQRRAMNGDYTGREEWASAIARMSDEDREAFFNEVDFLIFGGAVTEVLTTEQMEEVRLKVIGRKDEIQADNQRLMKDWGVSPEYMHAAVAKTHGGADMDVVLEEPDPHVDDDLDEDGLPAWPADLGSEAWDEHEQRGES